MSGYYVADQAVDLTAPLLSPLLADPTTFHNVTLLVGEYDPFRLQGEAFVKRVGHANGDTNYFRYGGISHAFLNFTGNVPAVEDALMTAAKFI